MKRASSLFRSYDALGFRIALLMAASIMFVDVSSGARAQTDHRSIQMRADEQAYQWPSSAKRYALVIGVDQYTDKQITPLTSAANDAKLLAKALVENAGFSADQVVTLTTDQPDGRQPTRAEILSQLSNLAKLAAQYGRDGLLLVAFAGHGIERDDRAFLLPSDARVSDDVTLLQESAVSLERHVHDWIRSKHVGQVVVLLDACRTDPTASRSIKPNRLTAAYTRGLSFDTVNHDVEAFATIYATGKDQQAYENTRKKQGFFMEAVVEGIKGAAANEKGLVTLGGLLDYLEKTVPKRVAIEVGADKEQRPWAEIKGYKPYELVIASAPQSLAMTATTADQYAKKGQSLSKQEKWAEAEIQYREALRLEPNKAQHHFNLAESMFEQQKLLDAENEFRQAMRLEPNHAAWHIKLGTTLQEQKRWVEAEAELREATRLEPNDAAWHSSVGLLLAQLQKWADAEAEYTKAAALEPKRPVIHYNLAVTLFEQQKWTKAEAEAREAVKLDQANAKYQELLRQIRNAYTVPSQNSSSASDTTSTQPGTGPSGAAVTAIQHKQAGDLLGKQKKWDAAELEYRQTVQMEPGNAQFRSLLAGALFGLEKWPEAETQLKEAVRLDPGNFQWYVNLGFLLGRQGRWAEAEREYREAVRLQPNSAQWHDRLGGALMEQKQHSKAESEFREAVRLEPHKGEWYYHVGLALHYREKWKEAETQFLEAVRLEPKRAASRFYLGFALAKRDKWREAIEVMREAIRMDSNNAVLRSNLSIVLTNVKSWGEAEIEIREAIRLDPTSSKYPDLLRRMLNKEVLRF